MSFQDGRFEFTWPPDSARPFGVTIRLAGFGEQFDVSEVHLRTPPGAPRPISAEMLRAVPLGQYVKEARSRLAAEFSTQVEDLMVTIITKREEAAAEILERQRSRLGIDHYREVVRVYVEAMASGQAPTAAVAEHFECPRSTAARWVSKAREIGLLDPAAAGKASAFLIFDRAEATLVRSDVQEAG